MQSPHVTLFLKIRSEAGTGVTHDVDPLLHGSSSKSQLFLFNLAAMATNADSAKMREKKIYLSAMNKSEAKSLCQLNNFFFFWILNKPYISVTIDGCFRLFVGSMKEEIITAD